MTARAVRSARVENEFLIAVVMPAVFALGLYLPLKSVMEQRGLDYAQFLVPIIVLQTSAFTAVSAAQRSALDAMRGMNRRLSVMPVRSFVPLTSRMVTNTVRSIVSVVAAVLYGSVLGFRFGGSVLDPVMFVGFALLVGAVFSLGADALGLLARNPEATSQLLVLPQLVLGLLSTGFAPESSFPEWAQPFARNQPISHFAAALRELAQGTPHLSTFLPAALWLAGLTAVFVPLAVRAQRKSL
ncbi:ABC transporter permease [Rhodococcus sp. BP-349]|nr:ABC transporter permease [Rhodococcus sp. BP-363]MBY6542459.1 ABC transporter permease [Rhodococcus sp. BP-369]MBY6561689.1 ABC transporter permease [Rhodococcus sp. BP-370]MBY6575981.1 ABC transporter permease [Rhodococcus sp. BP-364]MBY6585282.1 ABC transporter permease [Rhodococcus sp. BP-358]MBY6589619.1 ABC transporter permease [Rhodococcus sp. BP-362]MBY6593848.1 ABC transporter permease [Rhodococcus sp. BP-359]MBY6598295.1 ABC transporter permease [Rhodococcus sp. BP-353]MBY660252